MNENKRRRTRVKAAFTAEVRAAGRVMTAEVRDVSLKGLLLSGSDLPAVGEACQVVIVLGPGAAIELAARVVRSTGDGAALVVESMDAESFSHLRQLVRYHASDPDTIDDEIAVPRA
jgi:hypothetical protein